MLCVVSMILSPVVGLVTILSACLLCLPNGAQARLNDAATPAADIFDAIFNIGFSLFRAVHSFALASLGLSRTREVN